MTLPDQSPALRKPRWSMLPACLVASGAAALIYEVVWLRQIALVMGSTVYALSTVLTVFLGGLALGAYLGGRLVQRRGATARLYAGLEVGIAATALLVPVLLRAFDPLFGVAYRGAGSSLTLLSLVQFALCVVVLLLPTMLMGMTLPVVVAVLRPDRRGIAVDAGRLYGLNSLGAVIGAASAGLLLLPELGQWGTTLFAAATNVLAGAVALLGPGRKAQPDADAPPSREVDADEAPTGWPAPSVRRLIVLYTLAGFTALSLEVGWVRIVSLAIGSTTYGFTITLTTFIAGLALGSLVLPRLRWIRRNPVRAIFALHLVVTLWTLASIPFLGTLPVRVAEMMSTEVTFQSVLISEFLLVQLTIAVPTIAMGGVFPLVADLVHRSVRSAGRAVGVAYAANTLGNIAGSLVAGFVLVPAIGMRTTIVLSAVVFALLAIGYLLPAGAEARVAPRKLLLAGFVVLVTAIAACTLPAWDREIVTSGPYVHGRDVETSRREADISYSRAVREQFGELIDYREGPTTVAAVRASPSGQLELWVGGVLEARVALELFRFLGHLPMTLHGNARTALVVGLGSGTTLASVAKHAAESVDCVEISPEVVAIARQHFTHLLGGVFEDPRVNMIVGDGRNHLRHSGKSYDVIVSQPTYPWVAGASNLFTREYFTEIRDHLNPGGIACVWSWAEGDDVQESILRAWRDVFPNAYRFSPYDRHILVGIRDPGQLSAANASAALQNPAVRAELKDFGLQSGEDLMKMIVSGPDELAGLLLNAPVNTDNNGFVEFRALPTTVASRLKRQ